MRFYSTRNKKANICFSDAVLRGFAPDGGIYFPETIPQYMDTVKDSLSEMSLQDIAFETAKLFIEDEIPDTTLQDIIHKTYNFPTPIFQVGDRLVLELFYGQTATFKDIGAHFTARLLSYLRRGENKTLNILLATTGDSGSAIANAFHNIEGINVFIVYPKGKLSPANENEITVGGNIKAISVEGNFDDCYRLVKSAYEDSALKKKIVLASADAVNISFIISQIPYLVLSSAKSFKGKIDIPTNDSPKNTKFKQSDGSQGDFRAIPEQPLTFAIPSGNYGHFISALYAIEMGAPIRGIIAGACHNAIPDYLTNGYYSPGFPNNTISNSMDIGLPNNFERIITQWSIKDIRKVAQGVHVSDDKAKHTILRVHNTYGYFLNPHTAVAWHSIDKLHASQALINGPIAVLATAHPAKFPPLSSKLPLPPSLKKAQTQKAQAKIIKADTTAFLEVLQ